MLYDLPPRARLVSQTKLTWSIEVNHQDTDLLLQNIFYQKFRIGEFLFGTQKAT